MPRRNLAVAAVVAAASLSACGLNNNETGTPPAAASGARPGGVLRVGVTPPGGIDPLTAYEPVGKLISSTLCDTPVALDPSTGQVREALARGWVATKNGLTVKLRRGVRFNDGSELRSIDANYSLQQLVAPANGSFAKGLADQFNLAIAATEQGDVLEDPTKAPDMAFTVSKHDYQLAMLQNDGGALRSLAEPAMALFSKSAHEDDPEAFSRKPVCVGPYALEKPFRNGDAEITLVRARQEYYGENVGYTGGGKGYADRIVFRIYPTPAAAVDGYNKGEVDVVRVPRDLVKSVADAASLVYGVANAVEFVGLPASSNSGFTDVRLRRALSQAIDRDRLVADVFGPSAQVATGFEPPALSIREGDSLQGKSEKGAPVEPCPALTAKGDAPASVPDGVEQIQFEVNDDGIYPAMADAIAAQWREKLGLDVVVTKTPWDQYAAKASGATGFEQPFRIRWSTDAVTPVATYNNRQTFLRTLAGSDATNFGNWGHWDDRAFQFGVTEEMAPLTQVQQRGLAANKAAERLCDEMPMIPLVFDRPAFLVRQSAVGLARKVPVSRNGVLLLRELYLKSQS